MVVLVLAPCCRKSRPQLLETWAAEHGVAGLRFCTLNALTINVRREDTKTEESLSELQGAVFLIRLPTH
eukprot:3789175-Amphidinium_carterae.1